MNKSKKLISFMIAVVMVFIGSISVNAATQTGTCGENAYWTYDSETSTLRISGSGAMDDYDDGYFKYAPWNDFKNDIRYVVIDGIDTIGRKAFSHCDNLVEVSISDTVTTIHEYAFEYCKKLPNIDLPDSIEYVEYGVFHNCTSLTEFFIPKKMELSQTSDFCFGCDNLVNITVAPENPYYSSVDGFLCSKDGKIIHKIPANKGRVLVIPNGVEVVNGQDWASNRNYSYIVMPDTVTDISIYFHLFPNLKVISLPQSLKEIHPLSFQSLPITMPIYCAEDCSVVSLYSGTEKEDYIVTYSEHEETPIAFYEEAASCCSEGFTDYICKYCGRYCYTEVTPVDPNNHTGNINHRNHIDATCVMEGKHSDTYCTDCGATITVGATIPMIDHVDADHDGFCDNCLCEVPVTPNSDDAFAKIRQFFISLIDRMIALLTTIKSMLNAM